MNETSRCCCVVKFFVPRLVRVVSLQLRLAASLEQASHHVVSDAFIAAAREQRLALTQPEGVRESRGSGITGLAPGPSSRDSRCALSQLGKVWAGRPRIAAVAPMLWPVRINLTASSLNSSVYHAQFVFPKTPSMTKIMHLVMESTFQEQS
jgi:hypothetical protein